MDMRQEEIPQSEPEGASLHLLDLLAVVARRKRSVTLITAAACALSLAVAFLLPKVFTATAVLMPPQEDSSTAAAILGQLTGGLGAPSNIAGALGLKNPNDLYIGILKSRSIADRLIDRFKLLELYEADTLVEARKELAKKSTISSGKHGLITIEIDDHDPKRAAALANAYVEELELLTGSLALTESSKRRIFYDKQLQQVRRQLHDAESALRKTQEDTGLVKLDDQSKAIFESAGRLQGLVAAKEVQLGAMAMFATARNPDYILARQELSELRAQLFKVEKDKELGGGSSLVPTGKIPEVALEYLRKFRDVKYFETLFEVLSRQYEIARIDEGKNTVLIQVVDTAAAPDQESQPKKALIIVVITFLGLCIAILSALTLDAFARLRATPAGYSRIAFLVDSLTRKHSS